MSTHSDNRVTQLVSSAFVLAGTAPMNFWAMIGSDTKAGMVETSLGRWICWLYYRIAHPRATRKLFILVRPIYAQVAAVSDPSTIDTKPTPEDSVKNNA
ncbi:hypothetical protein VNI00_017308 [Paramarasmius palmivorus]|uniref:Uncharacterized protein n=1 Tax=Paramarasmius palmivorus TaxID=297713 RepID=A0AAW0B6P0_9AGAR